jgi:DNA-binding NarL/FixJ family response regulator
MVAACVELRKTRQAAHRTRTTLPAVASARNVEQLERLTPREIEVLRLIAEGLSTKAIAGHLDISFKTVVSHRTHLLEKLGFHESATLVRFAVHTGVVPA